MLMLTSLTIKQNPEIAEKRLNAIRSLRSSVPGLLAMRIWRSAVLVTCWDRAARPHAGSWFWIFTVACWKMLSGNKGEPEKKADKQADVEIELNISAFIADSYIEEPPCLMFTTSLESEKKMR